MKKEQKLSKSGKRRLWKHLYTMEVKIIEVGTITSFYKILMNLKAMKNFVYLLVPSDDRLIEFKIKSLHSPTLDASQLHKMHK